MTTSIKTRELPLLTLTGQETRAASSLMGEESFRAFYDRTSRPLWLYLARITGEPQLAEDLLQEAFYRFYRAAASHESESHRRNSLFRIATNLARDTHRRRHGVVTTALDEVDAITFDRRLEERADLGRALEQLTRRQREMLWLAYGSGLSHAEIASVVGVGHGSVKGILRRARVKLAELLGGRRG